MAPAAAEGQAGQVPERPTDARKKVGNKSRRSAPAQAGSVAVHVDWARRRLVAHARATPPGGARAFGEVSVLGQALAEAQVRRALAEAVVTLPLGAGATTPAAWLATKPHWRATVARATAHFVATDTAYDDDGSTTLTAYLPLDDGPAQLGGLWLTLWRQALSQAGEGAPAEGLPQPAPPAATGVRPPTGFVVQARGLGLRPALWPRIHDRRGRTLYGPSVLRPDVLAARGVAPLYATPQDAARDPRIGERPASVRAVDLRVPASADVVLADDDVAVLLAHPHLLRDGRVVLVADLPSP